MLLFWSVGPKAEARVFLEHMEFDDGEAVFHHARKMGLEGIVSNRKYYSYRSGRSDEKSGLCRGEAGGGGGLGALVPKRGHGICERRHQCPSYGNHQNEDHWRFGRRRWNVGHDTPSRGSAARPANKPSYCDCGNLAMQPKLTPEQIQL